MTGEGQPAAGGKNFRKKFIPEFWGKKSNQNVDGI